MKIRWQILHQIYALIISDRNGEKIYKFVNRNLNKYHKKYKQYNFFRFTLYTWTKMMLNIFESFVQIYIVLCYCIPSTFCPIHFYSYVHFLNFHTMTSFHLNQKCMLTENTRQWSIEFVIEKHYVHQVVVSDKRLSKKSTTDKVF